MTSPISINDFLGENSSYFKLQSVWRNGWESENYDESKELAEISACQAELSSRFSSQIIASEAIIISMEDEEPIPEDSSYRSETIKKLENVFKKNIEKPRKNCNKNYCRYIISNAIKAMDVYDLPLEFKQYYKGQQSAFSGFQVLKQHLIVTAEDKEEIILRKQLFQRYLLGFLEEKASLFILKSKKRRDIKEYLKYKNQVMTYYVRYPQQWSNNTEPSYCGQQHQQQQLQHQH